MCGASLVSWGDMANGGRTSLVGSWVAAMVSIVCLQMV